MIDVPDSTCPETYEWLFHLTYPYDAAKDSPENLREAWDGYVKQLGGPLREAFSAAAEHGTLVCDRVGHWPSVAWDNLRGLVTLAGDAAHPMTYRALPIPLTLPQHPHGLRSLD